MVDYSDSQDMRRGARRPAFIVIIERRILMQTCVLRLLKRELAKFEVFGARASDELTGLEGQDVRLIVLDMEDKPFTDTSVISDLAIFWRDFPSNPVVVISDRDDDCDSSRGYAIRRARLLSFVHSGRCRHRRLPARPCGRDLLSAGQFTSERNLLSMMPMAITLSARIGETLNIRRRMAFSITVTIEGWRHSLAAKPRSS